MKKGRIVSAILATAIIWVITATAFASEAVNVYGNMEPVQIDTKRMIDSSQVGSYESMRSLSEKIYEPKVEPCDTDEEKVFDPEHVDDIIVESIGRGASIPKDFFNLDGQDYWVSGTYDTTIYTSYYFYPNASGELYWSFSFEWTGVNYLQKMARVELWDKTDNKLVNSADFYMLKNNDGTYGPWIHTGNWRFFDLNPVHQYYFRFSKTWDGINANVIGVVFTQKMS